MNTGFCRTLTVVLLVITTGTIAATAQPVQVKSPASSVDHSLRQMADEIFRLVNAHRVSIGLPALKHSVAAAEEAEFHSSQMSTGDVPFGHDGFDGRIDLVREKEGPFGRSGENVAGGGMSAAEAVEGWLNSPGHRRNIEGDFTHTGVGVSRASDGHVYLTQIFYKK